MINDLLLVERKFKIDYPIGFLSLFDAHFLQVSPIYSPIYAEGQEC